VVVLVREWPLLLRQIDGWRPPIRSSLPGPQYHRALAERAARLDRGNDHHRFVPRNADPATNGNLWQFPLPPSLVVMQHPREQRARQEDLLAAQAHGMHRRPAHRIGDLAFALRDLLGRGPCLAVEPRPLQLAVLVADPLLPDAGNLL